MPPDWLDIRRGTAPLLVSLPHTGTAIPPEIEERLVSPWLARKDADWWIDRLYDVAAELGATTVRTAVSRTVIDVNRDPSGVSLYPGQATTGLCPTTTFDGEPLYRAGRDLADGEAEERRSRWFDPYHAALDDEVARLKVAHGRVVVYDCHSIRSVIPRLFAGRLPVFNIGTAGGASCAAVLSEGVAAICRDTGRSWVVDGRFRGGYITRRLGRPEQGVHAIQMELACRAYLREPEGPVSEADWPVPYDPAHAAPVRDALLRVLRHCLAVAAGPA
ncbi:N-formylglutamate deformylase [Lichenibacterium ramalinae]|uniref:N-formylglutamate deformylase n=1 Tax=Lichenibacterium ramalinae TaxID=2316527 RepID=A0A4Q2RKY0_9HYPH|nr:N-formylglutamate deformylase [Lichenibacterium ramalinae]RYB08007.1 N-formylglutamate deformylase [Lichenibacterium ramalinae]